MSCSYNAGGMVSGGERALSGGSDSTRPRAGGGGGGGGGDMGAASAWGRDGPALLSTALLLGGSLPERSPPPLFTIDSILAPRPPQPLPPLQLHHFAHSPFHRAHDFFGTMCF